MWVSKAERAWRRRGQQASLARAARRAEAHFAAFDRALEVLHDDPVGQRWMERFRMDRRTPCRSWRLPEGERAEGLSVIESVVLAGVVVQWLSEPAFVRWLSRVYPATLVALHLAAEPAMISTPLGGETR